MNNDQKTVIQQAVVAYTRRFNSQSEAARSLVGVSEATISQIINGKWTLISDEMWRKVDAQCVQDDWQHVETTNFKKITKLLKDAHLHHQVCAITGEGGVGKSHAFRKYAETHKNVIWLKCEKYWTQKHMLRQILKGLGYNAQGSLIEMVEEIVDRIRKRGNVIIIMDQFNKLRDGVKDLMIPLYNELEDQAGFFISGTSHLKTSFKRGVRLNKEGYQEMYSRMGRKFIEIKEPSQRDVKAISMANGIESSANLSDIWTDCERDLRRVRRKIHGIKEQNNNLVAA